MPKPSEEKHPERKTPREHHLEILDDLCQSVPGIAERREMLLLIPGLMEKVELGYVMDAIVHGKGVGNTMRFLGRTEAGA